jgi:hypothetical protein
VFFVVTAKRLKHNIFKPPNSQYNIIIPKHNDPPSLGQVVCRRPAVAEHPLESWTFSVGFVMNKLQSDIFLSSTPLFSYLLLTLHIHSSVPNTTCIITTNFKIQQDIKWFYTHGVSVTNYYHEVPPLVVIVTTRSQYVGFSCSLQSQITWACSTVVSQTFVLHIT